MFYLESVYILIGSWLKLLETEGNLYRGKESSAIEKAKMYYAACMNTEATEQAGATPLLNVSTSCSLNKAWNIRILKVFLRNVQFRMLNDHQFTMNTSKKLSQGLPTLPWSHILYFTSLIMALHHFSDLPFTNPLQSSHPFPNQQPLSRPPLDIFIHFYLPTSFQTSPSLPLVFQDVFNQMITGKYDFMKGWLWNNKIPTIVCWMSWLLEKCILLLFLLLN